MKLKLVHPLWTHLPAVLLILIAIFFTVRAFPLPDSAPIHFDINGQPNGYGSPLASSLLLFGLSIGFLVLSAWLDELWARQEKKKAFNWMSLFDEMAIGNMCGVQIAYVNMLSAAGKVFTFPWIEITLAAGLATALAVALELIRPYRHYEKSYVVEDMGQVRVEIAGIIESGQPLAYSESQNPAYANALAVIVPVIMLVTAFLTWSVLPWLSILLIIIGLGLMTTYGGFRTLVTRDTVAVKMGILGINLLQLDTSDIAAIEIQSFSPLRDFGGYGIRFNLETQAYYLKGDRGVKLTTNNGKK